MRSDIIFVTSHPACLVSFMLPHMQTLKKTMYVQALANSMERDFLKKRGLDVEINFVPIMRPISPWRDITGLWFLYWQFKKNRPFAVHTVTPKAGLLGVAAAWMAGVPVRVHSFTGQVWVTRKGFIRYLLKLADKLISILATDILVDSPSQQSFLIEQGVLSKEQSRVLGSGSICGVNTERFSPDDFVRKTVRAELGASFDTVVCLYLGRLNRDKGVLDLATAFSKLSKKYPSAQLWIVGPDEGDYFKQMQVLLGSAISKVKRLGYTSSPERYMQGADLLCLPSYREGFGSTVIEAASCGVPALVSRIYGLTDAVIDGRTGWMHEAGDIPDLIQNLDNILSDPAELKKRGQAAREFVQDNFSEHILTGELKQFYDRKFAELQKKQLPVSNI